MIESTLSFGFDETPDFEVLVMAERGVDGVLELAVVVLDK